MSRPSDIIYPNGVPKSKEPYSHRVGTSPLNHIPVPRRFRDNLRESVLAGLTSKALEIAERRKGEALTLTECQEIGGKLREELTKRGFFDLT